MFLALGGDAHHQLDLVAVPVDALGVGHDHNAGALNEGFYVVGAVGNGHMAANGHREAGFPVQHALDIGLVHIAALHHQPAAGTDSLLGGDRGAVQHNVLPLQEGVFLSGGGSLGLGGRHRGGGGGGALPRGQELIYQGVVLRRAHEVVDGDDPGLGRALGGPAGQLMVGDHDLTVPGNLGDGVMDNLDTGDARVLQLVAQHGGTHGGGAHARVAGEDDLLDGLDVHLSAGGGLHGGSLALGSGLGGGHLGLGLGQAGVLAEELQQEDGDGEADCAGYGDAHDVSKIAALGGHEHLSDDGAGGGRGHQAAAQDGQGEDAGDVANHGAQDDNGVHQYIGEVNFVDAAHELDEGGGAGGGAGLTLAGHAVGQQQAKAGAGVGLDHEQDGLAGLQGLGGADGGEHAVVDGVVQEEHLGGLHQHSGEGQQAVVHKELDARAQQIGDLHTCGADGEDGQHGQDAADDAHGKVVDHHLKSGGNVALHLLVKLLDAPAAQRAADHGSDKHGALGGGDRAQGGQRAGDGSLLAAYDFAAGVANEDGQQVGQHGAHHAVDGGGRAPPSQPAVGDEQGGDQAPGDEGPDVGHYHAAEEAPEFLYAFFHRGYLLSNVGMGSMKLRNVGTLHEASGRHETHSEERITRAVPADAS